MPDGSQALTCGLGSLPRGLHPRPGPRRQPRKDVQDQGQRHRPHRDRQAVRHRCGPLHAGLHGLARHRHRLQRGPHRRLPRLRQQNLERRPLPLHERGPRRRDRHHRRSRCAGRNAHRRAPMRRSKPAGSSPNCTRPRPRSTSRSKTIATTTRPTPSISSSGAASAIGISKSSSCGWIFRRGRRQGTASSKAALTTLVQRL